MTTPFTSRKYPTTICLFDVDGTLSLSRRQAKPEMIALLAKLREICTIGFVGGSDLVKQKEQLGENVTEMFDFAFSENGLTAYRLGNVMDSQSFIKFLGEEKYQTIVNFVLEYVAKLKIPVKRGTFVEFRNGMMNVSPIGRNCSLAERDAFEPYDKEHKIRETFVSVLKEKFKDYGLTYSIGGQISFDIFPNGWDKTYCLQHLSKSDKFDTIHFFGDRCLPGGNDYELFSHADVTGHHINNPEETAAELKKLFKELN